MLYVFNCSGIIWMTDHVIDQNFDCPNTSSTCKTNNPEEEYVMNCFQCDSVGEVFTIETFEVIEEMWVRFHRFPLPVLQMSARF